MPIRTLSTSVVNKIAAGEVVERPASVVKELVENSLDAGALRIDVAVEQGGTELVRVTDSGSGIAADELPLAVASHATSKLTSADDLFHVGTLGFRGEALASIAEVSRFMLKSRTADSSAGAQLEVVAGQSSPIEPCGCPPGTAIEVRNLFFNTPVRRKFLRSMQTEMGHLSEAFMRLALAHPQVHFTLRHNNRPVYDLPPAEDWLQRIAALMGRELADELIWIESRDENIMLSGYVARPSQSRAHNRMQYLFLNGRHIRDRSLQHALSEAYRGLLLTGRYPISFLRFDMPPDLVDVNVHPTKLEVRFQDGGRLYSQLLATLRTKFLATDLTHRIRADEAEGPAAAHDPQTADRLRSELVDWAKGQMASWPTESTATAATATAATDRPQALPPWAPSSQSRLEFNSLPARASQAMDMIAKLTPQPEATDETREPPAVAPQFDSQSPVRALQVHDRYLVAESAEGVLVIDQHALHERILYEQIRNKVLAGALESQSLLVPDAVDLSAAEAALVAEHGDLLARLGLRIDPFGGDTVLITSYPAMLAKLKPVEVLRAVVDQLVGGGRTPERRDLLDELLHTIACKAAIKAGDRLSSEEVAALVELRHLAQDAHHCPHGRPTALVFTREELDRQFMRT